MVFNCNNDGTILYGISVNKTKNIS